MAPRPDPSLRSPAEISSFAEMQTNFASHRKQTISSVAGGGNFSEISGARRAADTKSLDSFTGSSSLHRAPRLLRDKPVEKKRAGNETSGHAVDIPVGRECSNNSPVTKSKQHPDAIGWVVKIPRIGARWGDDKHSEA